MNLLSGTFCDMIPRASVTNQFASLSRISTSCNFDGKVREIKSALITQSNLILCNVDRKRKTWKNGFVQKMRIDRGSVLASKQKVNCPLPLRNGIQLHSCDKQIGRARMQITALAQRLISFLLHHVDERNVVAPNGRTRERL